MRKKIKSDSRLFQIFVLIVCIFLYGFFLEVFRGFPKGLDAYAHLTMGTFILEHWPNIRWYPFWYAGLPYYLTYVSLPPHLLLASLASMGLPMELSMTSILMVSTFFMGVGVYCLIYEVTKNRNAAFITSFAIMFSPVFWWWMGFGGPYARFVAMPFLPFSMWAAVKYVKSSKENKNKTNKKFYIITILFTFGALSHMQVGAFAFLTVFLIILFGLNRWKERILHLLKISIPVAMLSAYLYLPFLTSKLMLLVGSPVHLAGPISLSGVLDVPPVMLGIPILLGAAIAIFKIKHRKFQFRYNTFGFLVAVKIMLLILFIYSFLPIPPQIYVFSPYDCLFYLSIYWGLLIGVYLGRIFSYPCHNHGFIVRHSTERRGFLAILFGILFFAAFQYPYLANGVVNTGEKSWFVGEYCTQQLIRVDENEINFRFGSDWDATRWFNYVYQVPQIGGFYDVGDPNREMRLWANEAIWKNTNNYRETNFLLDWYAIKWFIVAYPHYNYEKFLSRPTYYSVVSKIETPTLYTMYQFVYNRATPIISPTNAPTLLVVGDKTCSTIFRSLAYANYNSRYVIPIQARDYVDSYNLKELLNFDAILIDLGDKYYDSFEKSWELLRNYVEKGGGVIFLGNSSDPIPEPCPVNETRKAYGGEWDFEKVYNHKIFNWIDFTRFSSPTEFSISSHDNIRPWARTILKNHGYPLIVVGNYGDGRVIWGGWTPHRIIENKNFMESLFLGQMIDWVSKKPERISISMITTGESIVGWSVPWTTPNALGSINIVEEDNNSLLKLGYNFGDVINDDQVNYVYNLPDTWDWSKAEFFSMWVHSDGSNHRVRLYIQKDDYRNSYWSEFSLDWKGWKQMIFWVDQMNTYGFCDLANIDRLEIVINDDPDTFGDTKWNYIYIDNILVGTSEIKEHEKPIVYRPNPEKVILKLENAHNGVLLKESHSEKWHAFYVDAQGQMEGLNIHKAGPGFMYVHLPDDIKFPTEIIFKYQMGKIEWFSYLISVAGLIFLIGLIVKTWATTKK
jgi:hypothetical protein